jgi:hypothetical protein
LTPSRKYEIFLQLIRHDGRGGGAWKVDRTTTLRIRTVAKQGAPDALSASRSEVGAPPRATSISTPPGPTRACLSAVK